MEIAPVPGIRALRPVGPRMTTIELHAPPIVEGTGRMQDDSYAEGRSGDRAREEELARQLEQEGGDPAKTRPRRTNTAYGEPYHRVDVFV
ncbi:MAG TPA: hypothetical protein VGR64_03635 [Terracidiphilus sp.]|nr:hypothetical protein [Terracidiphilus sp.]